MYESQKFPGFPQTHFKQCGLDRLDNGAPKNDSFRIKEEGAGYEQAERGGSESEKRRVMKQLEKEAHQARKQGSTNEGA
jgi:hypothetical protein